MKKEISIAWMNDLPELADLLNDLFTQDIDFVPDMKKQKGLGKELLGEAIRFSKERNCLRLTLLTDFNNDVAIQFYLRFGFKKSEMIPMRLVFE